MNSNNYVGDFEEFFEARQAAAEEAVFSQDQQKLAALLAEQEQLTQAILDKMAPSEDNASLLSELEAVIILVGELSHRHIYTQGIQEGARLARLVG